MSLTDLQNLVRVRAALDGQETIVTWQGQIHARAANDNLNRYLFSMAGVSLARTVETDDGYLLLNREYGYYYLGDESSTPLTEWDNPLNGKTVPVAHLAHNIANQPLRATFPVPVEEAEGFHDFTVDIPHIEYPSPLTVADYPEHSAGDKYRAREYFRFRAASKDIADPTLASVPMTFIWKRTGPWLPFMAMGQAPGELFYDCYGRKLNSYSEVPDQLKNFVEIPAAPHKVEGPNQTSWTSWRNDHPPASGSITPS